MKTQTTKPRVSRAKTTTKTKTASHSPPTSPPTTVASASPEEPHDPRKLARQLKELRLPTMREEHVRLAEHAAREHWTHLHYLEELTTRECQTRTQHRVAKLLRNARLLEGKSWEQFRWSRLPLAITQQFETLRSGVFLDRHDNVLIFGRSGTGKTNLLCALGEQLARRGRTVLFTTCQMLVQQLLRAKRDLALEKMLKKLSKIEALIIDDIGYVQQSREEMEVMFTLLSERYERGSVLLSSNLKFSQWDQIFKDPLTTQAAIDRVIHHSVIIELNIGSVRLEEAKQRQNQPDPAAPSGSSAET